MEIRANYILVGAIAVLLLFGVVAFTLWEVSSSRDVEVTKYDISFEEGVRGLSLNSEVQFGGIRVGRVMQIKISHVKPGAVTVRVAIASDTPVREDSSASLELRGITGSSVVSISGGTATSPLVHVPEGVVGLIRSEPSTLTAVVNQMPDLIQSATHVLNRVERVFSDKNITSVTETLASLNAAAGSLSSLASTFEGHGPTLERLVPEIENTLRNFDKLVVNANEALMHDVKSTTRSMNAIAQRVDGTLRVMEPGLKQFSTQGLTDMRMLMVEMRNLVHVLTRIGQKLESDPRRFLFGEPVKEYRAP